jgi:secreted PhoX family phosphatase
MHRRQFLTAAGMSAGAVFATDLWAAARAQTAQPGDSPYGPLGPPDANGIRLPEGFTSQVVARAGESVADSGYAWPIFPDGAAAFPTDDGGWTLAVNSEVFSPGAAGVSALVFDAEGTTTDAYSLLSGTEANCAGGPTPWGTWLSGEEFEQGQIWECDPTTPDSGEARPALGVFIHEAVTVDADREQLYLSEDHPDGGFYRFTPDAYPSLDAGLLEIATRAADGSMTWNEVPDPSAAAGPCRDQLADSTAFNGGEGCWYDDGTTYLTTKGDDRVWAYDVEAEVMDVVYDAAEHAQPPLRGVDNLIVESGSGDVLVAEDGGDMQIVLITPEGDVAPLMQITGEPLPAESIDSEVTGLAFSPDGTTLYFASQRGGDPQTGIGYAVTGAFRGAGVEEETPSTTTVLADAGSDESAAGEDGDGEDGGATVPIAIGAGVVIAGAAGAAVVKLRSRGS